MLADEFLERWVDRLRREVPDAIAIFLGGSYVRGDAGPDSDVDFDMLVADGPRDEWPAWFDVSGDRLVRISTWIRDVETWLAGQDEPQEWAFFLACTDPLRLCWAADESWRQRLDRAGLDHPAGAPEFDHLEGEVGKAANAWRIGDELALRLAAQDLARSIVSVLQPLNPRPRVTSRRGALTTLLDFDVVPVGYRDDMLACLAVTDRAATADDVHAAASRLARGAVELAQRHMSVLAPLLPAQTATQLGDGSLRRYVDQLLRDRD